MSGGVQSKVGFVRGVWRDCLYSVSCVTGQLCAPVCVGVAWLSLFCVMCDRSVVCTSLCWCGVIVFILCHVWQVSCVHQSVLVWRDCLYSVSCVTGQLCAPVCVGVAESCWLWHADCGTKTAPGIILHHSESEFHLTIWLIMQILVLFELKKLYNYSKW